MASSAAGRRRYQWLLLLVVAALLLVWIFVDGTGSSSPGERQSGRDPSHDYTSTVTPTAGGSGDGSGDGSGVDPHSGLPLISVDDLPPEAVETLELIDAGGPFPEPEHDGGTFQNREGILPDQPMGYYREYTVLTPGSDDRGARRIVSGGPDEFYWTADHYSSFERIVR